MIPLRDDPGPRRTMPWVTWGLIAINVVVFLYQISLGAQTDDFIFAYSVVPKAIVAGVPQTAFQGVPPNIAFHTPQPVYLTLLTSMFMHGGWLHLGGNMLYLYIFGDNVEDRMGHFGYLIFYLFCGLVASTAQILVGPDSVIPSLGASGAIAGVLAAYLVLFPWSRVRTVIFIVFYFTLITVPAILIIGIWFALQFFDGLASLANVQQAQGGVAYFAHIGGFVAGLLITLLVKNRLQPPAQYTYPYFPRHPRAMERNEWGRY